jgi:hypothetical protein
VRSVSVILKRTDRTHPWSRDNTASRSLQTPVTSQLPASHPHHQPIATWVHHHHLSPYVSSRLHRTCCCQPLTCQTLSHHRNISGINLSSLRSSILHRSSTDSIPTIRIPILNVRNRPNRLSGPRERTVEDLVVGEHQFRGGSLPQGTGFPCASFVSRVGNSPVRATGRAKLFLRHAKQVDHFTKAFSETELLEKIGTYHAIGIRSKTKMTAKVIKAASHVSA